MKELELEVLLKAVSYNKRLLILLYLINNGECSTERIAQNVKLPYETTFRNLTILRNAGFISARTSNAKILFKANPQAGNKVNDLTRIIRKYC